MPSKPCCAFTSGSSGLACMTPPWKRSCMTSRFTASLRASTQAPCACQARPPSFGFAIAPKAAKPGNKVNEARILRDEVMLCLSLKIRLRLKVALPLRCAGRAGECRVSAGKENCEKKSVELSIPAEFHSSNFDDKFSDRRWPNLRQMTTARPRQHRFAPA